MQTIGGFQRSTLIDFPGKVACSVFFNGCNFKCGFCHNPFLIFNCSELISKEDVLSFLDKRVGLLDGVVLSGGEPCMSEEIVEFARKVKEKGFLVKLDTNGAFPEVLEKVLPYVDYVAMDIKGSKENYSKVIGVEIDISKIEKSVELVQESGVEFEFRMTCLPKFHDKLEIFKIGQWLEGSSRFVIQQFISKEELIDPTLICTKGFREEELKNFQEILQKVIKKVDIRSN
ncbi:anaerobic ribonucleoside-triphosphate reductase activating protein [archaeon]|jgi:pyruvate formate lyase activating enzyme|nr:anaerobic ribonucleoside-triphosphate reductase activating protein [archaeon]MBT4397125.1 anaerobic ribonucleoside-triphosphate reductase activating protein [archaeon]MBT4441569.1 anaerobic ribonucleoside-triphosphate reductase activating protein [archaeon]